MTQFCRRQKAVQRLLAKELEKEKLEERKKGKRTKSEDARSCKPGTQYLHNPKSETPCESVSSTLSLSAMYVCFTCWMLGIDCSTCLKGLHHGNEYADYEWKLKGY